MAKTSKKKDKTSSFKNLITRLFDWFVICTLGLIAVFILVGYLLPVKEKEVEARVPDRNSILVELFDGCGRKDVVQDIRIHLIEKGIDVPQVSRTGYTYPVSLVVDRIGAKANPGVADSLSRILGVSEDQVVLQRIEGLQVDATIVIGLDYPKIIEKLK